MNLSQKKTLLAVALIGAVGTIIGAFIQGYFSRSDRSRAATAAITGIVVDQETNHGIGQATVTIAGRPEKYVTEDNGDFRIEIGGRSPQTVRLYASKPGFQTRDTTVQVPAEAIVLQLRKIFTTTAGPRPEAKPNRVPTKTLRKAHVNNGAVVGSISQGPCSNLQIGGTGNQAQTNCGPAPPQFSVSALSENIQEGGSYATKFRVRVIAAQDITLHVRASAQSVTGMSIDNERPPEEGGMAFEGTSRSGNGWLETEYWHIPAGSYFVTVETSSPVAVKLHCW